jgi:hypothetical protein
MDERIEKARGDRNQLLDQLLHISDKEVFIIIGFGILQ